MWNGVYWKWHLFYFRSIILMDKKKYEESNTVLIFYLEVLSNIQEIKDHISSQDRILGILTICIHGLLKRTNPLYSWNWSANLIGLQGVLLVTDSLSLSDTVWVCHRQSVSVSDSLCLSQTVCDYHRQSVSITDSLCLSQTVCVCHWQSVSVSDSLCLWRTVYVCRRQPLSVMGQLCLCLTIFLSIFSHNLD